MAQSADLKVADLRRILFVVGGVALVVVIVAFAALAWGAAERLVDPQVRRELAERSHAAASVVEATVQHAHSQVEILTLTPSIVDAAISGGRRARQLGLDRLAIDELERRMESERRLSTKAETDDYLRDLVDSGLFAEVFVTDRNGFVVASSGRTSDFVQRDEEWWQTAFSEGAHLSEVELDESAASIALSLSMSVPGPGESVVGVVKAVFHIGHVNDDLMGLAQEGGYIQVIDERGLIIADPHPEHLLTPYAEPDNLRTGEMAQARGEGGEGVIGIVSTAVDGRWSVVSWMPEKGANSLLIAARRAIVAGVVIALLIGVLGVAGAGAWVAREISLPVRSLASAADKVGAGDLRIQVAAVGSGEVVRLCVAVQGMVDRLRDLVTSIREASFHTRSRSHEIASAVQQLSAGTEEMTGTLTKLTESASRHSDTIQKISGGMETLGGVARELALGAEEATGRSRQLRELSEANRERLREGRQQVEHMTERASLATSRLLEFMNASRQFGEFVDLIQQFARRTNLLALNAAIEAARAGGEARGFAVLAEEIRKLATQAGDAADRAQDTTNAVLGQLEAAQAAIGETQQATESIGSVVDSMDEEFNQVAQAMGEGEKWAIRVSEASASVDASVSGTAEQLSSVADTFSEFAAAMEELAAGMQEQSASTEEIAAAVNALNISAAELASYAQRFTVDDLPEFDDGAAGDGKGEGDVSGHPAQAVDTDMSSDFEAATTG
ncbi:MAG: methyl-accepting chemotaxis protein [Gemmatimonadota bacterium]